MIVKGGSRAKPIDLARHLQRTDTNERVSLLELQSPTGSLDEALRDWQMLSQGTKGRLGLYHANIDPEAHYTMSPEQWMRAVELLEQELGFEGQPRAIILHEKYGREHIHVVWQRTDIDRMVLKSDSQNYQAHERASLRMEQEFGHEHVPGKHAKRDRDRQPEFPQSQISHDEWQQAERNGLDPRARKEQVKGLFEASDNGQAFQAALADAGYILAAGDRRGFVIVDEAGTIHSLTRQLPGVRGKALDSFMGEIQREHLPSAEEARIMQAARRTEEKPKELPDVQPTKDQIADADRERTEALRRALSERYAAELAEQESRHAREVEALQKEQQVKADQAIQEFAEEQARRAVTERHKEPEGLARLIRAIREAVNDAARFEREASEAQAKLDTADKRNDAIRVMLSGLEAAQRAELDNLVNRQGQERADMRDEHRSDLSRRLQDEERAQELARAYEERRQQALEQDREGPERGDRAL